MIHWILIVYILHFFFKVVDSRNILINIWLYATHSFIRT